MTVRRRVTLWDGVSAGQDRVVAPAAANGVRDFSDRDRGHVRGLLAVVQRAAGISGSSRGGCSGGNFPRGDGSGSDGIRLVVTDTARVDVQTSVLAALAELRRLLSCQLHAPIQAVIDLDGITCLVQLLGLETSSCAVKLEAAWSLTNIAAGNASQTMALVDASTHKALFVTLLSADVDQCPELCDTCLWVLGNIAGTGPSLRDKLLGEGIIGVLGKLFIRIPGFPWQSAFQTQTLRTLTWLMSLLCRGRPPPPLEEVDCTFDYFAQVFTGTDDAQMLSDALWGLVYLMRGVANVDEQKSRGHRFFTTGFDPGDIPNTRNSDHPLIARVVCVAREAGIPSSGPAAVPALALLGLIVSSPARELVDAALQGGALRTLCSVLQDERPEEVQLEAAEALANIAVGHPGDALLILKEEGLWSTLATTSQEGPRDVSTECAWTIAHVIQGGSSVLERLNVDEALRLVAKALRTERDVELLRALLEAGETLLRCGAVQGSSLFRSRIDSTMSCVMNSTQSTGSCPATFPPPGVVLTTWGEESGLLEKLEELQHSNHAMVKSKAGEIIKTWFAAGRENEQLAKRVALSGADGLPRIAGVVRNRNDGF
eukprot:TRINITY_DN61795_c0_g1_i1.p1 TRINITY_DN61795_c0_g1~~TRINITY_DN61795_c0_g1_i1.p1  ORF type:complete len:600 (-),score=86.46 TRINITY_DN61795_c0_g1_i1:73-1872(-)